MTNTGFPTIPFTPANAFADKFSWGYQVLGRLDYTSAFAGINMSPSLAYSHDVQGNTPLPLGNFVTAPAVFFVGPVFGPDGTLYLLDNDLGTVRK